MTRVQQAVALLIVALFSGGGLIGLKEADLPFTVDSPAVDDGSLHQSLQPVDCKGCLPADMRKEVEATVAKPQLRFEENRGQAPEGVRFLAQSDGASVWLHDEGIVAQAEGQQIAIVFPDASPTDVVAERPLTTRMHHYVGQDPDQWLRDVPTFGRVVYQGLWPGVDLVVYGTDDGRLEFDHVVAPGTDPEVVRFHVVGADAHLEDGALVAGSEEGAFRLDPPVIYQDTPTGRQTVEGAFMLTGNEVRYLLGPHDPTLPLVIDPVLRYASFLGTSGYEEGRDLVVHDPGTSTFERHLYVTGYTNSFSSFPSGFPSSGQHTHQHDTAPGMTRVVAYIAKFEYNVQTRTTTALWYAYLGGHSDAGGASSSATDMAMALDVDASGEVVVAGQTISHAFPTVNPIVDLTDNQGVYQGSQRSGIREDVFVARLAPDGDDLLFSTYIGGMPDEGAEAVALAPGGEIVIAGWTQLNIVYGDSQYPTKNADQPFHGDQTKVGGTPQDAFLTMIDDSTTPATFVFSTFLGGYGADEQALGLAVDNNGIYVGGKTDDASVFPTTPTSYRSTGTGEDGFLARYALDGTKQYATLLGGSGVDEVHALTPAGSGEVWAVGRTDATNFPTCPADCAAGSPTSFQGTLGGGHDGFVVRMNAAGDDLTFSSYLGGSGDDQALAVSPDPATGGILLAGSTDSIDLPLEQEVLAANPGAESVFAARVDPAASSPLRFSSYLGGADDQSAYGVGGDEFGVIYLAGETETGFPTQSPVQGTYGGGSTDAFLMVLGKRPPDAWIRASWNLLDDKSDVPDPTASLPVLVVPVGSPVALDALLSKERDFPLDPSTYEWTLYDGPIVEQTATGGDTPAFSPYQLNDEGTRVVCVRVHDDRPLWHPDGNSTACIAVEWEDRSPIAVDDAFTMQEDTVAFLNLTANDNDPSCGNPELSSINPLFDATVGTARIFNGSSIEFTPAADVHNSPGPGAGPVVIEYVVTCSSGATATATVTIVIENVNDPPTAVDDEHWTPAGATTDILVLDNDIWLPDPEEAFQVVSVSDPDQGSVAISEAGDRVRFTAPMDFMGWATFTYTMQDADGLSDSAEVRVWVQAPDVVVPTPTSSPTVPPPSTPPPPPTSSPTPSPTRHYNHQPRPASQETVPDTDAPEPAGPETKGPSSADGGDKRPRAVALGPDEVQAGHVVLLDASKSSDPDGDVLTFRWRQVDGAPVDLQEADGPEPSFTAPSRSGALGFELEVSDGHNTDTAELSIAVLLAEPPAFEVEVLEDGTHRFEATSPGSWSLGDGATATGDTVAHRFAEPGAYPVRLEVDGVETVQWVRVEAAKAPVADVEPDAPIGDTAGSAQTAAVPEPRIPTAVTATAAGIGLLALIVWAYRTWALVWIRVFTRVGKPDLLEHPLRSQIHDVVQDRPGIVLMDLVEILGKSRRTVLHHVSMLEGAGVLTVKRSGRYTSIHPAGSAISGLSREAVLKSPVAQRVMEAAAGRPGISMGELAGLLGVTPSAVTQNVARLEKAGMVKKVKQGRSIGIFNALEPSSNEAEVL